MRRLLQLVTLCLFLAAFLAPLAEGFDRWDIPGLANDTEFAVFILVLTLSLVLTVSKLLSAIALLIRLVAQPHGAQPQNADVADGHRLPTFFVPPLSPLQLRI